MSRRFVRLACLAALLPFAFALSAAAQTTGQPFNLSGEWKTRFGPISLIQQGDSVTGKFQWEKPGKFSGRVEGHWLIGHWQTADGSRTGTWKLEILTGANRLAGVSTPDGEGETLNFSAIRAELLTRRASDDINPVETGATEPGLTGAWTASLGEFTLRQQDALLTGLFGWDGGGRLTGRRDGADLRGEWFGRDGSTGRWHARFDGERRHLQGLWIDNRGGVQHWTARASSEIEERDAPLPGASEPLETPFTGQWRSRFGKFRLTQALQIVSGQFEWDGGGGFSGTVLGGAVTGKWSTEDGAKAGTFTLRALPGGRILQGTITTKSPEPSSENWSAIRIE